MSLLILNNNIEKLILKRGGNGLSTFFQKRVRYVLFVLILFSVISCGLPTYSYLYPPELSYTRNAPEDIQDKDLIFKNANDNDTNIFSGYEIYYKIYDPIDSNTSDTEYITDRTKIAANKVVGTSDLLKLGFSRLYVADTYSLSEYTHSETKPAFILDSDLLDENFNIRLKFLQDQSTGSSFLAETYKSSLSFSYTPYLYRRVENSSTLTTSNKFFDIYDFDINDNDMPDTIDSSSYNASYNGDYYLYISFFILSYGRDINDITTSVYSESLYLGTLKFECELTNYQ